jgi:hypothetical protein
MLVSMVSIVIATNTGIQRTNSTDALPSVRRQNLFTRNSTGTREDIVLSILNIMLLPDGGFRPPSE